MNKFLSFFKTVGTDVEKGLAVAAPIVGEFVPAAAPVLNEIAVLIAAAENGVATFTPEQMSAAVQALTAAHVIKQSVQPSLAKVATQQGLQQ